MLKIKTDFGTYNVCFEIGKYVADGSPAIQAWSPTEGPVATLTKCLDDITLEDGEVYIDTNNCPWALDFLVENGLAEEAGRFGISGYCLYPVVRLNMDKVMEHAVGA